jgi:hypothetical protein
MGMSHELPSHLTRTDDVSEHLLYLYEQWLRDGGFDYEANRYSSSCNEAERRALLQVASQWLASLAKQGKKLVVATQHCCRYSEGTYQWSDDRPWQTSVVNTASELFSFAIDDTYYLGCYDGCYDKVRCFVTK